MRFCFIDADGKRGLPENPKATAIVLDMQRGDWIAGPLVISVPDKQYRRPKEE